MLMSLLAIPGVCSERDPK